MAGRRHTTTVRNSKRKASGDVGATHQKKAKRRVSSGEDADISATPSSTTLASLDASQTGQNGKQTLDSGSSTTDSEWAVKCESSDDELGKHIQLNQL
jgi:hypothetical protein